MKSLVKPKGTIVNYRKALTGLSKEDLDHVTLTREEARKQVKAVLQQDGGCILCGHAVHNDLRALRLHHPDVIDTSFIFQYRDLPLCSPALKDLAKIILGLDIRLGDDAHHDSYEDSFVTMKLIQHELAKGPTPLLMPPDVQVPKEDLKKLFVHRLPPGTKEQDILSFFRHGPFESIEGDLASRKAFLVFKTPEDANSSFKLLNGTDTHQTDNLGRAQKEVRMALNKSFLVRKMASHNGRLFGKDRTGMRELLARSQKQGAVAKSQKQSPKANHLGSRKRKAEPAADKIEGKSPVRAGKAKRPRGNKDKATDKA